ncbi:hypothetical protein HPP92_001532 [Vanilla planifolia]|uniref:Chalcone--flavanone isomerase n=1 Tax=Vanilla planifolia TaxID=51239 RepID=A0A835VLH3_VANPL|nr:hypothetical protein HPP92_001532 [Vanilla planifolia]
MVSLRFPFSLPHRPGPTPHRIPYSSSSPHLPALEAASALIAAAATAGIGIGLANFLHTSGLPSYRPFQKLWGSSAPLWASISFADSSIATAVEPKTGIVFPTVVDGARRLLCIGLRKKSVFGMKNIDVYAFGVYADEGDLKMLRQKYEILSGSQNKEIEDLVAVVLDQDVKTTVRLQIVYSRLSIGSVRSGFEETVGNRIKKLNGSEDKELLRRFTSLFKDEYKLQRGSVIDLSREKGYTLQTRIDGKEIGSIQSKLLCQSILDLYIVKQIDRPGGVQGLCRG